ncbi:hypothetical protein [Streptomyces sp. CA-111067]|uniref:hypothetical protein n=1 Tax=Streptomyces sp. CA-111067 TaxID=3240046 RepID=UPI003D988A32
MSRGRCVAVALTAVLAGGALSGCGGDGDDGASAPIAQALATTTTSAPSAQATPAEVPFSGQTSAEIVQSATDVMGTLHTLTVDVTGEQDGEPIRLRMGMTSAGACAGHFLVGGGNIEIISTHKTAYLKGDRAGWIALVGGSDGAAVATAAKGKWLKTQTSSRSEFAGFCDLGDYVTSIASPEEAGEMSTGGPVTVAGQETVLLSGPADDEGKVAVYVATRGRPYILKAVRTGPDGDTELLSGFNKPLTVNPPPPSQTVDISGLHKPNGDGFSI